MRTPCRGMHVVPWASILAVVVVAGQAKAQNAPPPISESELLQWIQADLRKVPETDRPFTRYLSTAHLFNAAGYAKALFDDEINRKRPTGQLWINFFPAPGGFLFLNSSAPFDGEFNKALARELDSHPRALAA